MDAKEQMLLEAQEIRRFLDIADIREFIYDVDNDILENFRYGKTRETFFKGSIETWAENFRQRIGGNVNKEFVDFYNALKRGDDAFEHIYEYKGLVRRTKFIAEKKPDGGKIVYGVVMTGQLTQNKEAAYKRATDMDAMLNMLNKRAITEYAQKVLEKPDCPTTYLVIFDLDNFKVVNDSFGHLYGDEVLVTITDIINKAVGANGVVGRIGGDEILIVTKGIEDKAALRPMLREIRMNVEDTYRDRMDGISLTCSMGAAAYPDHGKSFRDVMDLADKMLYLAKEKGRNRYLIFTPELHGDILKAPKEEMMAHMSNPIPMAFDKIGIIQFMMEDYLRRGTSSNEAAFSNVGQAFGLNEILIVYENGKNGFRWTPEGTSHAEDDLHWIEMGDAFFDRFDENGLYVIDGLYSLQEDQKPFRTKLVERGIESVLFYKISHKGEAEGYVMYAKKVQRQKWSEYELLALSTIAKIFEMSVYK